MGRLSDWQARAKQAAASVRAEYEAGKRGDETPAAPIWATPQQQLEALLGVIARCPTSAQQPAPDRTGATSEESEERTERTERTENAESAEDSTEADEVAEAMRGVDWASVRAATAERTVEATRAMKEMAEHVDWAKVQPVAAQVSTALIAAIATGQLGVGGRLGSTVARAITNQGGLGQQVGARLQQSPSGVPKDLGSAISAVARDA